MNIYFFRVNLEPIFKVRIGDYFFKNDELPATNYLVTQPYKKN